MQAGIIEEMMDDAFESMEDQDELEEEAEAEVEKVLFELTAGEVLLIFITDTFHGPAEMWLFAHYT